MGLDSDHGRSLGEVGVEGVAIDTLDDMETLFGGIPLDEVTVSMTINAPAAILLAFYVVAAEKQGDPAREARRHDPDRHPQGVHRPEGVVLPDRAGAAAGRGHDRVVLGRDAALAPDLDLAATTSARPARPPSRSSPSRSRTASPTSSRRSSAASTSTTSRPRLSFFFNAHIDFFEEIAKYRAARRIWAREMKETYGAKREESLADALPHPDRGRLADRPAAAGQHRPHHDRGARRRARRHPVAAHQLLRRGAGAADRGGGAARPSHPAGDRPRVRGHQHDRPPRRLLLHRDADRRDGARRLRVLRPHRRAGRDGRGDQAELPPARDRRRLLPLPAGGRLQAADRGRGQRLRQRGRRGDPDAEDRPRAGAQAGRPPGRRPGPTATRPRSSARSAS